MYTVVHELWDNKGESTNLFYKTAQDAKDAMPIILINHSRKCYYKPRMALQLEDGTIETTPNHPVCISQVPSISKCKPPGWQELSKMHPEVGILKENGPLAGSLAAWKREHHPPKHDRDTRNKMREEFLKNYIRPIRYSLDGYKIIDSN